MTSDTDTVALIRRALDQTDAIIAAIGPGQAGLATPCADWDVRTLVRHVVAQDMRNFLVSARGETADSQSPAEELGEDWAAEFRERAGQLLAAWRAADVDQMVAMPGGRLVPLGIRVNQQVTELAVHDWDLVKATGQHTDLDPALAEYGLGWSRRTLRPESRGPGQAFGLEVPVAPDAPAYDRLAAWFGRDPGWKQAPGAG